MQTAPVTQVRDSPNASKSEVPRAALMLKDNRKRESHRHRLAL